MALVDLRREGAVFVLTMQAGENRFHADMVAALGNALDAAEASSGPAALVSVGAGEKFYSNGLDLAWMGGDGRAQLGEFMRGMLALLGRLLAFPLPTVAALNGHTFAMGVLFAMAHDYRVMRADRGFLCLPEIDLAFPLQPGMTALLQAKLGPTQLRDTLLTGARLGGEASCAQGFVDEALPAAEVLPRAIARAAALAGKDRATYGALKRGLYAPALALLGPRA